MKQGKWLEVFKRDIKNPFAVLFLVVFTAVALTLTSGWKIAFEIQNTVRCMPQTLWLINPKVDTQSLSTGDLVQIDKQHMGSNHPAAENTTLLKLVIGTSGDRILIQGNSLYVNNVYFGLLASQKYSAWQEGEYVLDEDEVWLAGTTETTLDSRYFGPVKRTNIIGQAYAIL